MEKVILIAIVLLVGSFFVFFKITIEPDNRLEFISDYKSEIGYTDYEIEKIISTDKDEDGLRLTFNGCNIDSTNIRDFNSISNKVAIEVNRELNSKKEFINITLIFRPKNENGIQISNLLSIDELKFKYKANEL